MHAIKDQKKLHDKVYEKTFDLKEYLIPSDRIKIKVIHEMLDIKKGQRILDVGCGTGTTLVAANGLGAQVIGIDISNKGLRKAKHKIESGSFVSGDAHLLPFKDNIFDAVICKDILEHLSNDVIALREVHRVFKKNGLFMIYAPYDGPLSLEWIISKILGYNYIDVKSRHLRRYKNKELFSLLEKEKFAILKERYFAHYLVSLIDPFFMFIVYRLLVRLDCSESKICRRMSKWIKAILPSMSSVFELLGNVEYRLLKKLPSASGTFLLAKKH